MSIELTFRCNNKCLYCYNEPPGSSSNNTTISYEDACRLMDIAKEEYLVTEMRFSGGEPTLHPRLLDLIDYAFHLKNKPFIVLLTNGRALKHVEYCKDIYRAGVRGIQISLQSSSSKVHDMQVGVPGAWEETVEGIRNALALYPSKGEEARVAVKPTLTTLNIDTALDTVRFLASLGVRVISPNACAPAGKGKLLVDIIPERKKYLQTFLEMGLLADSLNICCEASVSLDLCTEEWAKQKHIRHYACGRGTQIIQISPLGDLYVCDTWGKTMGNVLETGSVQDIFDSTIGSYYSEGYYLPDRCRACKQLPECGGVCSICADAFGYSHIYNVEIADQ